MMQGRFLMNFAYHKKENEAVWHNTALVQKDVAADGERIIMVAVTKVMTYVITTSIS